jgi:hypothetical protein
MGKTQVLPSEPVSGLWLRLVARREFTEALWYCCEAELRELRRAARGKTVKARRAVIAKWTRTHDIDVPWLQDALDAYVQRSEPNLLEWGDHLAIDESDVDRLNEVLDLFVRLRTRTLAHWPTMARVIYDDDPWLTILMEPLFPTFSETRAAFIKRAGAAWDALAQLLKNRGIHPAKMKSHIADPCYWLVRFHVKGEEYPFSATHAPYRDKPHVNIPPGTVRKAVHNIAGVLNISPRECPVGRPPGTRRPRQAAA